MRPRQWSSARELALLPRWSTKRRKRKRLASHLTHTFFSMFYLAREGTGEKEGRQAARQAVKV